VATIPSAGGVEDVVMRILAAGEPIPLDKLGLTPHNKARVEKTVEQALWPVLCVWPDRVR
jgi:type II secretory ATPase GspE/PulE/Tfp pilus assembly ATPase PilB-like protein